MKVYNRQNILKSYVSEISSDLNNESNIKETKGKLHNKHNRWQEKETKLHYNIVKAIKDNH